MKWELLSRSEEIQNEIGVGDVSIVEHWDYRRYFVHPISTILSIGDCIQRFCDAKRVVL